MSITLPQATLAVGALGVAATGLVDSTKAFWGGMSRVGFGFIEKMISTLVPEGNANTGAGLSPQDIVDTLRANWMNGMDSGGQKAIAKSFVKLHLNPDSAEALAKATNVNAALLKQVAVKMPISSGVSVTPLPPGSTGPAVRPVSNAALTPLETDAFGRFDLALSAMIDHAYERADQWYRNWCKVLAAVFAVALAYLGNYALPVHQPWWQPLIVGLVATPLAPVAKDIANAIQTASDTMLALKG